MVIIVILVITVLGLVGFVFWQNFMKSEANTVSTNTSEETSTASVDPYADWLTYTSDRAGFNLKYPSDWKVTDTSATAGALVRLTSPETTKEQSDSPNAVGYDVDVSFESTSGSMVASQLGAVAALKLSENGSDFSQYATKKYTETINSISVTEFDMAAQSPYFAVVFPVSSNYVQLSFPSVSTKSELTTNLSNIIASFKAN